MRGRIFSGYFLVSGALLVAALPAPAAAQESAAEAHPCPLFQRLSMSRASWDCFRERVTGLPESRPGEEEGEMARFSPVRLHTGFRSAYPAHRNRGLAWGGRGASTYLTGGVLLEWGAFTVNLEPEVAWSQNRAFPVPEERLGAASQLSPFAYPWGRQIDWPLRFGDGPVLWESLGQSFVEATFRGARAGASGENLWLGPARRYPLLLSSNAPGFPHLFLETDGFLGTPAGGVEAGIFWGLLRESGYFTPATARDRRVFTMIRLAWAPSFLEGLEVGGALSYQESAADGLEPSHLWTIFRASPQQDERIGPSDGKGSVHARWAFPDAGFEAWVELGRDDYWLNTEDFLTQPDHSLIFLAGFQRRHLDPGGRSGWSLTAEVVNTKISRPQRGTRGDQPFYVHSRIRQGHTHQGRILGPFVGSGSDAQYLAFEEWGEGLRWGLFAERIVWDDDTYFRFFETDFGFRGHDLEWTLGGRLGLPVAGFMAGLEAGVSRRKNRNFIGLAERDWDFVREWNLWFDVDLVWQPGLR